MSKAASLSLLEGGKKSTVGDELAKPAAPPVAIVAAPEPSTPVDIEKMTSAQLDELCKAEKVPTPVGWTKMKLVDKRTWLYSYEAGPDVAEAPASDLHEQHQVAEAAKDIAEDAANSLSPTALVEAVAETAALDTQVAVVEAKAKKPAKGKAVSKATGNVEVMSPDALSDLVHEIENLDQKHALAAIWGLAEQAEFTYFRLGGVLSVIQSNGWYKPYASFHEFVESEHGISYRKATYWVAIYNHLADSKVPWEKVKDLGWTKLKEIASILTPENVDEWVKIASDNKTLQLMEIVANHKKAGTPHAIEDQTSKVVTTLTFKVHEDQKAGIQMAIEKAKEAAGTTVNTVALESICMDYMASQTMKQKAQAMGAEAWLTIAAEVWPDLTINVEMTDKAA